MIGPETCFLVAAKDDQTCCAVEKALRSMGYLNIVLVRDGLAALDVIQNTRDRFLVTTWDLPGTDGLALLEELRGHKDSKNTPCIMIGAPSDGSKMQIARGLGVTGFILGAFNPETLQKKISQFTAPKNIREAWPVDMVDELEELLEGGYIDKAMQLQCRIMEDTKKRAAGLKAEIGMLLLQKGDVKGGVAELESALADNEALPRAQAALGKAYLEHNMPDKAVGPFEKAVRLDPERTDYQKMFGESLLLDGQYEKAEDVFGGLLKKSPNDLFYLNRLAIALRRQGKFGQAIGLYKQALSRNQRDENLFFNLGRSYLEAGKKAEAMTCFRKSLELNPGFSQATRMVAKLQKER